MSPQVSTAKKFLDNTTGDLVQVALDSIMKRDSGRWLMIREKLPPIEGGAPPVMSLHWSVPWPMGKEIVENYFKKRVGFSNDFDTLQEDINNIAESSFDISFGGVDPNPLLARRIRWKDKDVRLFDHEISFVTVENMSLYIEEGSHEFRPGSTAEANLIEEILTGDKKLIYDAALVDGATHNQAVQVALGHDLSGIEIPPIGWYECRKEYVQHFFDVN